MDVSCPRDDKCTKLICKKMNKKFDKAILFVLRYAIEHDGVASYNPCMYHLGYADNIPPSEEFNNE